MQLTEKEIIVLRDTFLFHHLKPADYVHLSAQPLPEVSRMSLYTGERFHYPDQKNHYLAVVTSGSLLQRREPTFLDRLLEEGNVIGVLDLFSRLPAPEPDIVAKAPSTLLLFTVNQIRMLFDSYPGMMMRYINFLTGQAQSLRWEYQMAAAPTAEQRVLLYLAARLPEASDSLTVSLPQSISGLASRLHMSRSSLYRILEQLEQQGILLREGHAVTILKPEAFDAMGRGAK